MMGAIFSSDLRILLRPGHEYQRLVELPDRGSWWQRPLFFAFLVGCTISLAASGRVTLRLVAAGTVYAALIPLLEIAVLWVLLRGRSRVWLGRAVDLFFMGHAAWCMWLLMLAVIFTVAEPFQAFAITGESWRWYTIGALVLWSGYTDYCFFRCVSPGRAGRNLLVQRAVCWSVGLAILGGGSLWTGVVGAFGK